MNTLSEYQQKFVDEVCHECREAMADYLSRGVDDALLEAKNLGLNVLSVMGYKV